MSQYNIVVNVENLEKRFGNFVAVNKINFSVEKGEIFGFLGPNGAGKSTTIRMLCGIILPTSGGGQVGGFDIVKEQEKIKQNIGYMSQKFSLYEDLTVEENIEFYGGLYGIQINKKKERKEWILEMAGLKGFERRLTRTLSGGWKQRLALGCAIIHEPKIVFLDEPTSGVDPIARNKFWELIKKMAENGVTVFVTTHYMDEAENCNRIALIYKGDIIASGSPAVLKSSSMNEEVLEICINNPELWIDKIIEQGDIHEAALFGTAIHAIVDNADASVARLKNLFMKEPDNNFSMKKIKPSLEDVFISLIEKYDGKR